MLARFLSLPACPPPAPPVSHPDVPPVFPFAPIPRAAPCPSEKYLEQRRNIGLQLERIDRLHRRHSDDLQRRLQLLRNFQGG